MDLATRPSEGRRRGSRPVRAERDRAGCTADAPIPPRGSRHAATRRWPGPDAAVDVEPVELHTAHRHAAGIAGSEGRSAEADSVKRCTGELVGSGAGAHHRVLTLSAASMALRGQGSSWRGRGSRCAGSAPLTLTLHNVYYRRQTRSALQGALDADRAPLGPRSEMRALRRALRASVPSACAACVLVRSVPQRLHGIAAVPRSGALRTPSGHLERRSANCSRHQRLLPVRPANLDSCSGPDARPSLETSS